MCSSSVAMGAAALVKVSTLAVKAGGVVPRLPAKGPTVATVSAWVKVPRLVQLVPFVEVARVQVEPVRVTRRCRLAAVVTATALILIALTPAITALARAVR